MNKITKALLSLALVSSILPMGSLRASDTGNETLGMSEILDINGETVDRKAQTVVIYANLSNQDEVNSKVQNILDKNDELIIVEVRDNSELLGNLSEISTRANGRWVKNTRSYFIGHITYATSGTISCYVVEELPPSVSGCSGEVTIYGSGVAFVSKTLYNKTSTSAYMRWVVRVTDPTSGNAATLAYTVPLYS